MHPQKTQISVISHEGRRVGVKQVDGRLCSVRQVCISPSLVSPPTSVTIQSGIARAATAKISAARNSAPEIKLNLSIFGASTSGLVLIRHLLMSWLLKSCNCSLLNSCLGRAVRNARYGLDV